MSTPFKLPLDPGITSRIVPNVNGLDMHILEAGTKPGSEKSSRPLVLLLHGFPELAYSYRKVIKPLSLAAAGYHVVAPDQRGYGRTTGWDKDNLDSFRMINLVSDIVALVLALGYRSVDCIIGHDFGSPVAGYCALIRPDMFRSVILMSAPFPGAPSFPPRTEKEKEMASKLPSLSALSNQLLALDPPRKHYQEYLSPPSFTADRDMLHGPQGVSSFLRAFYHMKSADWEPNDPYPLSSWEPDDLAKMPEYYIMHADKTMAETVLPHLPPATSACPWLTETELSVYATEFSRTSFQGGLNWYQFTTSLQPELRVFAEKRVEVPALFISGEKDWGMYQAPGNLQRMQNVVCEKMDAGGEGCRVVKGAGHWVQQEQPDEVVRLITQFLAVNMVDK